MGVFTMELIITTVAIGGAIGGFLMGLSCNGDVKAANEEINRQAGLIENLQDLCTEIADMGVNSSSGTARKMAKVALAGVAK